MVEKNLGIACARHNLFAKWHVMVSRLEPVAGKIERRSIADIEPENFATKALGALQV
jgi:hypothetical protein